MDPKRKKVYIVLIIVSLTLSAGILLWSRYSQPSIEATPNTTNNTVVPTNSSPTQSAFENNGEFGIPSVFPGTEEFNTEVLNSSNFRSLITYPTVDATGQLGRPDPFRRY